MMLKWNKWLFLVTAIITLLPVAAGLIMWDILPDHMVTHWGISGEADGAAGKALAVFLFPSMMLAGHLLITLLGVWDQKRRGQDRKVLRMMYGVFPLLSCYVSAIMYAVAFGMKIGMGWMMPCFGALFVIMGNYFPKCRQNPTLGIKIKWTLESEENWNATHRFGGKVWVAGGLLLTLGIFLPNTAAITVLFAAILVMVLLPVIYSYRYYVRQKRAGTFEAKPIISAKTHKTAGIITAVAVPLILIGVGILMFTGDVTVAYDDTAVTIDSIYGERATVAYSDIDAVVYREHMDVGMRTYGFASARLLLGAFQNDELGSYTRYSYVGCDAAVLIQVDDRTLVVSGKNATDTKAIYDTLIAKCQKGAMTP